MNDLLDSESYVYNFVAVGDGCNSNCPVAEILRRLGIRSMPNGLTPGRLRPIGRVIIEDAGPDDSVEEEEDEETP